MCRRHLILILRMAYLTTLLSIDARMTTAFTDRVKQNGFVSFGRPSNTA